MAGKQPLQRGFSFSFTVKEFVGFVVVSVLIGEQVVSCMRERARRGEAWLV